MAAVASTAAPATDAPVRVAKSQSGDHQRRIARIVQRMLGTRYSDPLFERPDLIEDDYYRFLNQPRG